MEIHNKDSLLSLFFNLCTFIDFIVMHYAFFFNSHTFITKLQLKTHRIQLIFVIQSSYLLSFNFLKLIQSDRKEKKRKQYAIFFVVVV